MTVRFYSSVLESTNGEHTYDPGPCTSLHKLVEELEDRYGKQFGELFRSGAFFFLINGKGTMLTGGLDTSLEQGDRIEVLPFVDAG